MARKLGTYMFHIRLIQLLIFIAIGFENGWLWQYIGKRRLGLSTGMQVIEFIVGLDLLYVLLQIYLLHCKHKSSRSRYLIWFIFFDVIFMASVITLMSILSVAGVPNNCQNLTRQNYNPGDAPNNPSPGYTTIRFGSGPDSPGELDKFCDLPRGAYCLCILAIYTYMTSIVLAIIRIQSFKPKPCDCELAQKLTPQDNTPSPSISSLNAVANATSIPTPSQPALAHPTPLIRVQTRERHELPTADNTTELSSPVSELISPLSPTFHHSRSLGCGGTMMSMGEIEPSISNGSRGNGRVCMGTDMITRNGSSIRTLGVGRSASVRSGPPPYMPASEGVISRIVAADKKS